MRAWLQLYTKLALVALLSCVAGCSAPKRADVQAPVTEVTVEQYEQALVLMEAEQYAEAELALLKVAVAYPESAGPYVNLGLIYQRTDRLDKAEQAYEDAVARNPTLAAAYNQLGILYRKQGRFEEATTAYSQAIAADPSYALAYLNHGVLLDLYLQRPVEALEMYQQYQNLSGSTHLGMAPDVDKWIVELTRRIKFLQKTAQVQP